MAKGKKDADNLEAVVGIRVTRGDRARLDVLAESLSVVTAHAIARFALLLGLDALERDPAILLRGALMGRSAPTRKMETRPPRQTERRHVTKGAPNSQDVRGGRERAISDGEAGPAMATKRGSRRMAPSKSPGSAR